MKMPDVSACVLLLFLFLFFSWGGWRRGKRKELYSTMV